MICSEVWRKLFSQHSVWRVRFQNLEKCGTALWQRFSPLYQCLNLNSLYSYDRSRSLLFKYIIIFFLEQTEHFCFFVQSQNFEMWDRGRRLRVSVKNSFSLFSLCNYQVPQIFLIPSMKFCSSGYKNYFRISIIVSFIAT